MPNRPKKIFLIAGETSGELHAAGLARALRALAPPGEVELVGMGGARMAAAGVRLLKPIAGLNVMGFVEILRHLGTFRRLLGELAAAFAAEKPDVLVPVDYPGFNLRFAERVRADGFAGPILYYVSPQVWAWHSSRLRQLARLVDRMLVVLPFEEELYRAAGIPVTFVGHPLLDDLAADGLLPDLPDAAEPEASTPAGAAAFLPRAPAAEAVRQELGLGRGAALVALLPGSRRQALARHLPVFLGATERLARTRPGLRFAAALPAESELRPEEEAALAARNVRLDRTERGGARLLAAADLVLVSSGTATLEAAFLGCPMVVGYRGAFLSWLIARLLVTVPAIALANIVAGKRLVPELIQYDLTAERLAAAAGRLLDAPPERARLRRALLELRRQFAGRSAGALAAREVLAAAGPSGSSR